MKVYITKYVLTGGIQVVDAELSSESPKMIAVENKNSWGSTYYYNNDWHETKDAALLDAEKRRDAKLKSLKKSIAKIEAMKFEIPSE